MKPNIVALIVTYNRKALLSECLDALLSQTYPVSSIIVIDNASTDGTRKLLEEKGYLEAIKYKRLKENLGGAGGFNAGIKEAVHMKADWIWAMDDDAIVDANALAAFTQCAYFNDPATGALAPKVIDTKGKVERRSMDSVILNEAVFRNRQLSANQWHGKDFRISSFPLLGILFRASIIKKIGNVESAMFIQCDDLDFTLRISDIYNMYIVTKSILTHKVPASLSHKVKVLGRTYELITIQNLWKEYYAVRNFVYILKKRNLLAPRQIGKLGKRGISVAFLDHKILRAVFFLHAVRDGYFGHLGKRVDPATFQHVYLGITKEN